MKEKIKLSLIIVGMMLAFGILVNAGVYAAETKSIKVSKEIFGYLTGSRGYGLGWADGPGYKYEETLSNGLSDYGSIGLSSSDRKEIIELSNSETNTLVMTIEQLNAIKEISILAYYSDVSDDPLYGIENFNNLTSLSIVETGYDLSLDLTKLEKLTKLKRITMTMVNADLTPLSKLQDLEYIAIDSNEYKASSLDFISHPEKLKYLRLLGASDGIKLDKLKDSNDLLFLSIGYDQNLKDVSALSNLTNLVYLNLSNCRNLEDISPISNLTKLQYVSFENCEKLKDITPLKKSVKNIGAIYLDNTSVSDISVLKDLGIDKDYLNEINISDSKITDFSDVIALLNNFESTTNYYYSYKNHDSNVDNVHLSKTSDSYGRLEFSAEAQEIQVYTKNKEYTLPKVFQQALLNEMEYNSDYKNLTDYGYWDKSGNFVKYSEEKEVTGVTLEIAGGSLSKNNKTAIFPENVKEGDTMCIAINGGLLHESHIVITYGDELKLGDINGDKKIDVNDAIIVLKHITGKEKLTGNDFTRADVTKDSKVDVQDAITILKYIVGKIKSF
ncbi:MAG: leucine-rich repeat protein [Clostridia bacterium]|nr:leucine-rich repeat protein [Clostridia bacterium]